MSAFNTISVCRENARVLEEDIYYFREDHA